MALDLSKLDAEQRAAATAQGKHALVFAGAGSGKTRTLTARVAWLLDQGVPASRIMAVTFTRKAADEMRRRLDKLVPEATTGLRIGTFHAQMAMGLRRYAGDALGLVGRSARFTVYDEDDRERLVGRLLREAGFTVKDVPEGHLCCGWAGTYQVLQPELSRRLRDRKVTNIESVKPDVIAAGNFGCIGNIASGTGIPIAHTVELLDWATGGPKPAALD